MLILLTVVRTHILTLVVILVRVVVKRAVRVVVKKVVQVIVIAAVMEHARKLAMLIVKALIIKKFSEDDMSILNNTLMNLLRQMQMNNFKPVYTGNSGLSFVAENYGCRNECSGSCEGDCYGSCDSTCAGGSQDYDDECWGLR